MGSENLFHRRKAKVTDRLRRRQAKRSAYDKVLIVCEGQKTEPNYFSELIQTYRLNTANVEIDGSSGSSPQSVLNRAIYLWKVECRRGDPFDCVYCVFDKDSHTTYQATRDRISTLKPAGVFYAAVSIPCFEYWLLLHFQYTTKPYAAKGASSIGNEVLKELKAVFPKYAKGNNNVFPMLLSKLEFAKENAERSLQCATDNHTDNPSTNIHQLVDYLEKLNKPPTD